MFKMLSQPSDLKKKKLHRCTILHSLYNREINGTHMNVFKSTCQTVHPNCSILDVDTPTPFLCKFSPDGRHLIAFSSDLTSVEVYDYRGCSVAADLLKNYEKNIIGTGDGDVRFEVFERLFKLKHSIRVTPEEEHLTRTCILFTEDGHHALVGSSVSLENVRLKFSEIYSNNESVKPNPVYPLEDYRIYLVNLSLGVVSHSLFFKTDKIYLNHNEGVYLLNNTVAILSVQHQTIYIYKIIDSYMQLQRKIGPICNEDDHDLIKSVYTFMKSATYEPSKERSINGLKHKFMVFLYNKAVHEGEKSNSNVPLKIFYEKFKQLLSFRIWKMQLLDENHLLIRYTSEEVVTMKILPTNVEESYFMIYDITTNTVLDIFENSSDELLKVYENFIDHFRHPLINPKGLIPCSISNNKYLWESYKNVKDTIIKQFDGTKELNKLVLGLLPLSAQSYTSSPYLDSSLYNYDEKYISPFEKPKCSSDHAIGFYSRNSGSPCFYIYTGKQTGPNTGGRLVEFTFHPTEPFAISTVKENDGLVLNFHMHKINLKLLKEATSEETLNSKILKSKEYCENQEDAEISMMKK